MSYNLLEQRDTIFMIKQLAITAMKFSFEDIVLCTLQCSYHYDYLTPKNKQTNKKMKKRKKEKLIAFASIKNIIFCTLLAIQYVVLYPNKCQTIEDNVKLKMLLYVGNI